jgi:hypothetical protein
MEINDIFKFAQKSINSTPLILVGTGCSIPYGIPGMSTLSGHLIRQLKPKYTGDAIWDTFESNLNRGLDLETALTGLALSVELLKDIACETWRLISLSDLALLRDILINHRQIALSSLIKRFCTAHPKCVNIITTNYDRLIEYACDIAQCDVNTKFRGLYLKHYSSQALCQHNVVNVIKIHGSLDVFKDALGGEYALPLQHEIPVGMVPSIITPGSSKYESILKGTSRQLLSEVDSLIKTAPSYLCIGYGFNDEQIQENIITEVRKGKPITLITKEISAKAASLFENNSSNYITIQEGKSPGTSEIVINRDKVQTDGTYWTIDGYLSMIE